MPSHMHYRTTFEGTPEWAAEVDAASAPCSPKEPFTKLEAPRWATPADIDVFGVMFVSMFKNKAAFDYFQRHGKFGSDANDRRKARLAADPIGTQRARLRNTVSKLRSVIAKIEKRITVAHAVLSQNPRPIGWWSAERDLTTQTARLAERSAALERAETLLALFDEPHAP